MREKNISDWPNNNAVIAGCVVDTPIYEFSVGNKSYYRVIISARRLSGTEDLVPCYIEDSKVSYISKFDYVEVVGHIRTKHVVDSTGVNHTKVYITENYHRFYSWRMCHKYTVRKTSMILKSGWNFWKV